VTEQIHALLTYCASMTSMGFYIAYLTPWCRREMISIC